MDYKDTAKRLLNRGLIKHARIYDEGGLGIVTDDRVLDTTYGQEDNSGGLLLQTKTGVSLNTISKAWKTGLRQTFRVTTKSGYELVATGDHKVMTTEGWVEVKKLKAGKHEILIQPMPGRFNENDGIWHRIPDHG